MSYNFTPHLCRSLGSELAPPLRFASNHLHRRPKLVRRIYGQIRYCPISSHEGWHVQCQPFARFPFLFCGPTGQLEGGIGPLGHHPAVRLETFHSGSRRRKWSPGKAGMLCIWHRRTVLLTYDLHLVEYSAMARMTESQRLPVQQMLILTMPASSNPKVPCLIGNFMHENCANAQLAGPHHGRLYMADSHTLYYLQVGNERSVSVVSLHENRTP